MAEASNRPNSTIYVGGLDTTLVTAATLSEAFIPFGEIVDITLPKPEKPSSTDLHRGFGYVEFEEAIDAKEAIDNMDQSELYGRVIKVAMAKPERKETGEVGLGSTIAIWEQVGERNLFGIVACPSIYFGRPCQDLANSIILRKDIWQSMPQQLLKIKLP